MTIFNLLTFIGGLAMFLFGMSYMGTSLEKIGAALIGPIVWLLDGPRPILNNSLRDFMFELY